LAEETTGNLIIKEAIGDARNKVIAGESLAEALRSAPFMPALFVQMVKVGEEGGALESTLTSMADFYDREVEDRLATMIGLVEPAMTLVMGVAVALIALAVMLPIFGLLDQFGGQP
jgi:type IV pilus assembly protein PilC